MTNQYFLARIVGRDPSIRAADADRERIADRLRKSHAEGRLDLAEFQQRLEQCYAAKTFGELDALVRDLPRQEEPADRPRVTWPWPWRWGMARLVPILLVLMFVSAISGHHHGFWLWVPLLFLVWRLSRWRRRWSSSARHRSDGWI